MAQLFVEINDNQKRVPSSLRWDLVRLVRPGRDPRGVRASDLMYELTTSEESPLYQRIDLTGETPALVLKQGSLAPEIKALLSKKDGLRDAGYEAQVNALLSYFAALRERDPDGWKEGTSNLYRNRVLRALLRLLPELLAQTGKTSANVTAADFYKYLKRINLRDLSDERIKAVQGSAGIKEIHSIISEQILK